MPSILKFNYVFLMVSYLKIYFLQCRLLALLKDANKAVTLEDVIEKHKVPSTHAYSSKYIVDKTITLGKLEGSVEVHVPSYVFLLLQMDVICSY